MRLGEILTQSSVNFYSIAGPSAAGNTAANPEHYFVRINNNFNKQVRLGSVVARAKASASVGMPLVTSADYSSLPAAEICI